MLRKFGLLGAVLALLGAVGISSNPGEAADHIDAPLSRSNLALDIGDVFAQEAPDNPDQSVIVMTANTAQAPGQNRPWAVRSDAKYQIHIDQDGDAKAESRITVDFGAVQGDGTQKVRVRQDGHVLGTGWTGESIPLEGGGTAFVGVFDDPFFLDFQAVLDDLEHMGGPRLFCDGNEVDFLGGLNTGAIVLQLPDHQINGGGDSQVGLWVDTLDKNLDRVVDRMGQPEVPTFFIEDSPVQNSGLGTRDVYNNTKPKKDLRNFGDDVAEKLLEFSNRDGSPYSEADVEELVNQILPDILPFDTASSDGIFEGNGRRLTDDGLDFALARATGGSLGGSAADPTDCIQQNDVELPTTFPYLAAAHEAG